MAPADDPSLTDAAADDRYNAFISYSKKDRRTAHAIQKGIQRLGVGQRQRPAASVFVDVSSLRATSETKEELRSCLDRSEWLIVVASTQSAKSSWVNFEIEHFAITRGRQDRVLVALAEGDLRWEGANGYASTTSCPPALKEAMKTEPLHADLRTKEERARYEQPDPDGVSELPHFDLEVARLAATVREANVEALLSADRVILRRSRLRLVAALVTLVTLLVFVVLFARQASRNEDAQRSESVASTATAVLPDRLDQALLLAAAAPTISDTAGAEEGLLHALAGTGGVDKMLHPGLGPLRAAVGHGDGHGLVAGSENGWLLDARVQPALPFRIGDGQIRDLQKLDDGRLIATLGREGVAVVDLDNQQLDQVIDLGSEVRALARSPRGDLIAGTEFGELYQLDLTANAATKLDLDVDFDRINSVAFSASGNHLVVGGRANADRTEAPIAVLEWPSLDELARTWDPVDDPNRIGCTQACLHSVSSIATEPAGDDIVLFGSLSGSVVRWDWPAGDRTVIGQLEEQVSRVRWAPDGDRFAAAGFDGTVRYWSGETPQPIGPTRTHHAGPVWDVVFSDGGDTASTIGEDGTIARSSIDVWSGAIGTRISSTTDATTAIAKLDETSGEPLIVVGVDTELSWLTLDGDVDRVWQLSPADGPHAAAAGEVIWALHVDAYGALAGTNFGTLAFDTDDGVVTTQTGLSITAIERHPSGSHVVIAGFLIGEQRAELHVYRPDGTLAADPMETPPPPLGVRDLAFSADGSTLLVGGFGPETALRSWPGLEAIPMRGPDRSDGTLGVAHGPNGYTALAANTQVVELYDADRDNAGTLDGTGDTVWSAAFHPGGRFLASGGGDFDVRIWDLENRQRRFGPPLVGHTEDVRSVMFTADGNWLVTASPNEVFVWNFNPDHWAGLACDVANRQLSATEWSDATGDDEFVNGCPD